jgi:hypothetical protein
MKLLIQVLSCIFALSITACATVQTGPMFKKEITNRQNEATVYIYRPDIHTASAISPMLYIDGKETFRLPVHGYVPLTLSLGEHTLETKDEKNFMTQSVVSGYRFNLNENGSYYIRWEPYIADSEVYFNPVTFITMIAKFAADVRMVPESQAIQEIKNYRKVLK